MYSIEGLENGIEQARKNITTFEEAIKRERDTIDEYYKMIDVLKEKERAKKAAEALEG